jgi:hypothetical protein
METTGLIITGTPEQIAEGLQLFADRHASPRPEPEFQDEKMTIADGARFMSVCYKTFCSYIRKGKVRVYGTGKSRFVLRSELIEDFKAMK